jgi:ring-1,2-phenylacetyl-CoA epoxidase subunit PaaE
LLEALAFGVKRIHNGAYSRHLVDHAKPGDQLMTSGAGGLFVLPGNLEGIKQIFFFAAGSGITPVLSLLKTILHFHPSIEVVLVYSSASAEATLFYTELENFRAQFKNRFRVHYFFSNHFNLNKAHLNRESLIQLLHQEIKYDVNELLFYICGPESYMRMCTYTLQEEQVRPEQIKRENFISEKKPVHKQLPPDKASHLVKIKLNGMEYQIRVDFPDSILQSAKKQGLALPYSCETGKCANCLAQCISGNVWLSYNEVLTDQDLKNGLTLTCTGHPVGGDVVLEIG